jgi:hypothetical protein
LLNQRDADGRTPSDLAGYGSKQHDISVLRCLQKYGGEESADLDRAHAKLVAAKKAEFAGGVATGNPKGFTR